MSHLVTGPSDARGDDFVPAEYQPKNVDANQIRNQMSDPKKYRPLKAEEIEILVKNHNTASNWNKIFVADQFDARLVRGCEFFGMVRIGNLTEHYLEYHDLRLPIGLYNSVIESCDIGNRVALRNIRYLSHYIIDDECILFNIDEMVTTNHSKFGVGVIKTGESESVRVWIELGNENGGRKILPFPDMLAADAYLWSKFRGDTSLMGRFVQLTDQLMDKQRGYYGRVQSGSVLKNCRIIKDVNVGACAYIKGANKLKNLTILSSAQEATQIGEGVELINGIVGYGTRIFYGAKAVRFLTGRNTQIKYGARLLNSYLGANSTVSCCEILNNLIFPFHEQHHNNSFLIAATLMGQSNIAANATIGSNHNSRAADGEIIAGRGFWPGLCSNFKHNSKFASFVLVSKGNYDHELNIPIPFSLVSRNIAENRLQVMPGYWLMYNMYAIARNEWKFRFRDMRAVRDQNIEMQVLAPDTIQEMLQARRLLLPALGEALGAVRDSESDSSGNQDLMQQAERFLENEFRPADKSQRAALEKRVKVYLRDLENSAQPAEILKPMSGLESFREMILYYIVKTLKDYLLAGIRSRDAECVRIRRFADIPVVIPPGCEGRWWNLGGQLVYDDDLQQLLCDIKSTQIDAWDLIHQRYDEMWRAYPRQRVCHALHVLGQVQHKQLTDWTEEDWRVLFLQGVEIQNKIVHLALESRKKDYENPFRKMAYDDQAEMDAVLGKLAENPFMAYLYEERHRFEKDVRELLKKYRIKTRGQQEII